MVATISTDPSRLKTELQQMETEMKRLVLGAQKFPLYLRNIQLKSWFHSSIKSGPVSVGHLRRSSTDFAANAT
jgi:hypothetical protein